MGVADVDDSYNMGLSMYFSLSPIRRWFLPPVFPASSCKCRMVLRFSFHSHHNNADEFQML